MNQISSASIKSDYNPKDQNIIQLTNEVFEYLAYFEDFDDDNRGKVKHLN